MAIKNKDSRPDYWRDYSNPQRVKHRLISEYLKGWFPKLGHWSGRVLYLDTHAGRGRHETGEEGSPLVALTTFLAHSHKERILSRSEVRFFFVEQDERNADQLDREIAELGELPKRVFTEVTCGNCFEALESVVENLQATGRSMAPAFVFVDPYGFKVPGRLLRDLMGFPRVELFINVIWRELDMAMAQARQDPGSPLAKTLDGIFDGRSWVHIDAHSSDERLEQCLDLFREICGARWATWFRMLGDNGVTRYALLHLTNHHAGRELIKNCLWKVCPDGGFYARKSDDPSQELLIKPQPDLEPLKRWILDLLGAQARRWSELAELLRETLWREPQLNSLIRKLRRDGVIAGSDFDGRFSQRADPLLARKP